MSLPSATVHVKYTSILHQSWTSLVDRKPPTNAGDVGSIPSLERSHRPEATNPAPSLRSLHALGPPAATAGTHARLEPVLRNKGSPHKATRTPK